MPTVHLDTQEEHQEGATGRTWSYTEIREMIGYPRGLDSFKQTVRQNLPVILQAEERRGGIVLHMLSVEPEERGKGLGTFVMERLCDYADCKKLAIGVIVQGNEPFYERFGFVPNQGEARRVNLLTSHVRLPETETAETA